jgi:hypothetical protein
VSGIEPLGLPEWEHENPDFTPYEIEEDEDWEEEDDGDYDDHAFDEE